MSHKVGEGDTDTHLSGLNTLFNHTQLKQALSNVKEEKKNLEEEVTGDVFHPFPFPLSV